jgi:outer membrane immunogenic protein
MTFHTDVYAKQLRYALIRRAVVKQLQLPIAIAVALFLTAGAVKADPWTGFYLGLNAGYDRDGGYPIPLAPVTASFLNTFVVGQTPSHVSSVNPSGFLGGLQSGYDNHLSRSFVGGVVTDIQGLGVNDSKAVTTTLGAFAPSVVRVAQRTDWLLTARAKLGILPIDDFLIYATGGVAVGNGKYTASITFPTLGQITAGATSQTRVGGVVGAGGQFALTDHLRVSGEYLLYDLGDRTVAINNAPGSSFVGVAQATAKFRTQGQIVRAAVDWKF